MEKKITRSRKNRVIEGVCGGLAEYFDIDATIVRLGFVISIFFGGTGIIAYIVAALVIPGEKKYKPSNFYNEDTESFSTEYDEDRDFSKTMGDTGDYSKKDRNKAFIGVGLIILGSVFFLSQFINTKFLFPVVLIVVGFAIVVKGRKEAS
ncbi:UNVERIFIED_CONTAM: phage shock protein C (PspC) family protein [Acetivibrio alkalicellulosi]